MLRLKTVAHSIPTISESDDKNTGYPCWGKINFLIVEAHDLDEDQRNVSHPTRFLQNLGYEVVSALAHHTCHSLEAIRKNK
jgi:hypothetical protein